MSAVGIIVAAVDVIGTAVCNIAALCGKGQLLGEGFWFVAVVRSERARWLMMIVMIVIWVVVGKRVAARIAGEGHWQRGIGAVVAVDVMAVVAACLAGPQQL
jgi:hypothetical protein